MIKGKISVFGALNYAAAISTTVCATVVTIKMCQDIAMNRRLKLRTKKTNHA